jgi:hypothetical protein
VIFQWFLRGICDWDGDLDENWAKQVLNRDGLRSAWLRLHPRSDPAEWDQAVNHNDSLLWHTTRFDEQGFPDWPDRPFGEQSPFLSLSSGTVEPDHRVGKNQKYPAWYTAVLFATSHGRSDGWVFHGYTSILGLPSLPLLEFSEEVRDLHQHDFYNPYHPEGEVVAKILIPPVRLKEAFRVTADRLWEWHDELQGYIEAVGFEDPLELLAGLSSHPVVEGDSYRAPDEFSNIRSIR